MRKRTHTQIFPSSDSLYFILFLNGIYPSFLLIPTQVQAMTSTTSCLVEKTGTAEHDLFLKLASNWPKMRIFVGTSCKNP